jgi:multicomponent Na+:H+ antiporter subunit E
MNPLIWLWKCICFVLFYVKEVVISNFRVAHDVLTPTHHMKPGFLAIPLDDLSERQILVLANLITMTPGTLSMDVSTDRKTLYLHAMYIDDPETVRQEVAVYQRKIREVF